MFDNRPETIKPWHPKMVYNPKRPKEVLPGLLEDFLEKSVTTFFRTVMHDLPNKDHGPLLLLATRYVLAIDEFMNSESLRQAFTARIEGKTVSNPLLDVIFEDPNLSALLSALGNIPNTRYDHTANHRARRLTLYYQRPYMMDQLVWTITHPSIGHPSVYPDRNDHFFIAILLIHHFRHHGGLVLPTLQAARVNEAAHQAFLDAARAQGQSTMGSFMYYPNWRDSLPQVPSTSLAGSTPDTGSGGDPGFGAIGDGKNGV